MTDMTNNDPHTPDHLKHELTNRGFKVWASILDEEDDASFTLRESSAADTAKFWVELSGEHVTADFLWNVGEQITLACQEHYQGDQTPPGVVSLGKALHACAAFLREFPDMDVLDADLDPEVVLEYWDHDTFKEAVKELRNLGVM